MKIIILFLILNFNIIFAQTNKNKNEKIDVSDLENKYWTPKEEEFNVVQNRTYTKAQKLALSVQGGVPINDQYSRGFGSAVSLNYYISERYGAELSYNQFRMKNNVLTQDFIERFRVMPNHNKLSEYYGASFNWVPIYAKISLLDKKILYFDMSFSPGIGLTKYESQFTDRGGGKRKSLTLSLDVAQHFFISEHFAFRFDLKNRFYNEDILDSRSPYNVLRTEGTYLGIMMFGITYYH